MQREILRVLVMMVISASALQAQKSVSFFSKDGILISADLYHIDDSKPYMILCHQAGSSRGEYLESAKRFNRFGYNCLAIDARSGGKINNIINETAKKAKEKKRPTKYLDAEIDIQSAIDYAFEKSNKKVILVGSSYSASLVMKVAKNDFNVKAVIAFSPGEYFGKKYSLKDSIKGLKAPLFVTSTKKEALAVSELIRNVESRVKVQFTPSGEGVHGSRTLWKETPNHKEYWTSLMMFMLRIN